MNIKKILHQTSKTVFNIDTFLIVSLIIMIGVSYKYYENNNIHKGFYILLIPPLLCLLGYLYLTYKLITQSICKFYLFKEKKEMPATLCLILICFLLLITPLLLMPYLMNDLITMVYDIKNSSINNIILNILYLTINFIIYTAILFIIYNQLNPHYSIFLKKSIELKDKYCLQDKMFGSLMKNALFVIGYAENGKDVILLEIVFDHYIISFKDNLIKYQGKNFKLDIANRYSKDNNIRVTDYNDEDLKIIEWMSI